MILFIVYHLSISLCFIVRIRTNNLHIAGEESDKMYYCCCVVYLYASRITARSSHENSPPNLERRNNDNYNGIGTIKLYIYIYACSFTT